MRMSNSNKFLEPQTQLNAIFKKTNVKSKNFRKVEQYFTMVVGFLDSQILFIRFCLSEGEQFCQNFWSKMTWGKKAEVSRCNQWPLKSLLPQIQENLGWNSY